ncbi:hypothetical protein BK699_32600 [Bacillus thuringiensis serovar mexicanensis]|uniref:Uncharacterized protein n=1 Tax=Bacillus thuringiensis serovar mexicanensis TaxID=180868 RepID=A0A242VYT3_BACTU|nr:hypothetical protein BK699_32600 [Bacillus thuringiensis serovar mexicanensis]OTW99667.1 hypothetical protein BK705_20170 [Bacillus thuringiensis serovar monterrey]
MEERPEPWIEAVRAFLYFERNRKRYVSVLFHKQ